MLRAAWWAMAAAGPPCVPTVADASLLGAHLLPQGWNLNREDTGGVILSLRVWESSELSLFVRTEDGKLTVRCFCLLKKRKKKLKQKQI